MPRRRNQAIKSYLLQDGTKKYMFQMYGGMNPITGKQKTIRRRNQNSYEEADAKYNEIKMQLANGTFYKEQKSDLFTYQQVFSLWWKSYRPTIKVTTADKTKSWFRIRILPEFSDKLINKIKPAHIQPVIDKWATELVNYKAYIAYLSRVFKYAMVLDLLDKNPMDHVIIPKKGKQSKKAHVANFWDPADLVKFAKFIESKPIDKLAMFRIYAMTGLRRGETLALTWRNVDLNKNTITIQHSINYIEETRKIELGPPKSDAAYRTVSIDDHTANILKDWRKVQQLTVGVSKPFSIDQKLFPNEKGGWMFPGNPGTWFQKYIEEAKLPRISLHGLRHTFASWMYENNKDVTPKDMQYILGHENIDISMNIYVHSTKQGKDNVRNFLKNDVNF